jgi:hypothetical protein
MRSRLLLALVLALGVTMLAPALEAAPGGSAFANHDVGPTRVYFPQTGHHLSMGFLDYWRHNGGLYIYGYPLTEEISEDGRAVQYFERAVFEWHPENPAGWKVLQRRLGADFTKGRTEDAFKRVEGQSTANVLYFPQTGHHLGWGFKNYWEKNGGVKVFGYPISEEFSENGRTVQYFERAKFEWHPEHRGTPYEILLGHLGRQAAQHAGVDTSPVARTGDAKDYSPSLWYVPAPPPPQTPGNVTVPPPGAPKHLAKWIEVDLTNQYLRAWQYDQRVYGTYVSTGTWRTPTPAGTFRVYHKILSHAMSGGTPGVDYYYLPNVPHSMYFREGGYAIHGAYWHSNWGTPMSRGCVNLPLGAAEWLYNWTPVGTTVWIHY